LIGKRNIVAVIIEAFEMTNYRRTRMKITKSIIYIFVLGFLFTQFAFARNNANKLYKKAASYVKVKDYPKAEKYFLLAEVASPKSGFYSAQVGQFYSYRTKQYNKSLVFYKEAIEKNFHNAWVYVQASKALKKLNRFNEAKQWPRSFTP